MIQVNKTLLNVVGQILNAVATEKLYLGERINVKYDFTFNNDSKSTVASAIMETDTSTLQAEELDLLGKICASKENTSFSVSTSEKDSIELRIVVSDQSVS